MKRLMPVLAIFAVCMAVVVALVVSLPESGPGKAPDVPEKDAGVARDAGGSGSPVAGDVFGVVLDGDGRPIVGAALLLAPEGALPEEAARDAVSAEGAAAQPRGPVRLPGEAAPDAVSAEALRKTTTGTDGRFRISPTGGAPYALIISHPGYRAHRRAGIPETGGEYMIVLMAAPGILGTVRAPGGEPVPGASVELRSGFSVAQRVRSGPDGAYVFGDVKPGSFEVFARSPAYGWAARPVKIAAGERLTGIDIAFGVPGVVAGAVSGPGGEPIEGATVTARLTGEGAGLAPPSAAGSSGPDGGYRIEGLPAGTFEVEAVADGFVPARAGAVVVSPGATASVDLRLAAGMAISGRVADPAGKPVAGAVVSVDRDLMSMAMLGADAHVPRTTSAKDGTFRLGGLGDAPVDVKAEAEGFAPAVRRKVAPGETGVEIVLGAFGSIAGRVTDAEGAPVADFEVEVVAATSQVPGVPGMQAAGRARLAGEGRYRVEGLPAGTYAVSVYPATFAPAHRPSVEVADGAETAGVDFTVPVGATLRGRVVEDASGAPVPGATLSVSLHMNPMMAMVGMGRARTAVSGADGAFVLTGLPEGEATLRASHERYAPAVLPGLRLPREEEIEVRLAAGGTVLVSVYDAGGNLRADSMVVLQRNMPFTQFQQLPAEPGRFTFERVPAGDWMAIRVAGSGMAQRGMAGADIEMKAVKVAEGETVELEFRPVAGVTIGGVVGRDGKQASGLMVFLMKGGGAEAVLEDMRFGVSDAEGRFAIERVVPGEYTLAVSRPGNFVPGYTMKVTVTEEGRSDIAIDLPLASVRGRIVDEAGKGVAGATLMVVSAAGADFRSGDVGEAMEAFGGLGSSGEGGAFALEGLRPGTYLIRAWREGGAAALSEPFTVPEVGDGPEGIVLTLPAGVEVKVRVRGPDGAPVAGAWLYVTDSAGRLVPIGLMQAARTLSDGSAVLPLAPGNYRIEAQAPGHPAVARSLGVGRGGGTELVIDLPAAGSIEAVVRGPGGLPLAGVKVELLDEEGRPASRRLTAEFLSDPGHPTRTDAEGRIVFPLLAPGTWRVRAVPETGRAVEAGVRVEEGRASEVTLTVGG
jgi:protocatechuate 3,4-dioxygenase beta subunit